MRAHDVPGAYAISALEVTLDAVYTNTTPTSPVRGAGRPYAIERMVMLIARELGLDPADVRRRNLVPSEAMPYETGARYRVGSPIRYDSGDFPACLEKAVELADYDSFRDRQQAAQATDAASASRHVLRTPASDTTGAPPFASPPPATSPFAPVLRVRGRARRDRDADRRG